MEIKEDIGEEIIENLKEIRIGIEKMKDRIEDLEGQLEGKNGGKESPPQSGSS